MKDSILVNKRRQYSYTMKENYNECWKISLKYSNILIKNINSNDLYNLCVNIYSEYIKELKFKKIYTTNTKNYIQIWNTMLNTVNKGKLSKNAIKILHQTNCQRVSS